MPVWECRYVDAMKKSKTKRTPSSSGGRRKKTGYRKGFSRSLKVALYLIAVFLFAMILLVGTVGLGSSVKKRTELFIPTGATYAQVQDSLRASGNIRMMNFEILSRIKAYPVLVKPGRYVLQRGSTALQVVNKLRSGNQDEIKLVFNKVRKMEDLAGIVSRQIEADSVSIIRLLKDEAFLSQFTYSRTENEDNDPAEEILVLNPENVMACFIPNTYYCFWNTDAEGFFRRMYREQDHFWNDFRRGQAKALGMNRLQVMTLASIVEEETQKKDERADVASVYLNRYRKGMLLQADPTVKFAVGDFSLRRILREHLRTDSPYNTYLNKGLPPGPICTPSISSIEAVLENKQTPYLYFCAKADFSGYHAFASTYAQHLANARAYQRELNRQGIR